MRTTAIRDGDHHINGAKAFISNGSLADLAVLAVKTEPSAGAKGVPSSSWKRLTQRAIG